MTFFDLIRKIYIFTEGEMYEKIHDYIVNHNRNNCVIRNNSFNLFDGKKRY